MNRIVVTVALGTAFTGLLVAGCSSDDSSATAPDASSGDEIAYGCPPQFTDCGGTCYNLKKDAQNCGKCGNTCKAAEVCVGGGCATSCGGGTTKCGSSCLDTRTDNANCGACGAKCASGQVCSGGHCALTCAAPYTSCGGTGDAGTGGHCADLQSSDLDCGVCGNACDSGYACKSGKCVSTCGGGLSVCPGDGGDYCADLTNDPGNCGSCGNTCKMNEVCTAATDGGVSSCKLGCGPGTTACGSSCVDTAIDPMHCGDCSTSCGTGTCYNSHCCSGTKIWCSGSCVDNQTDPNNCGGCGIKCVATADAGATCTAGICPCANPAQGSCAGDLCTAYGSTPMTGGCDPSGCVTNVCTSDPYCCTTTWDSICVSEVATYCAPLSCSC